MLKRLCKHPNCINNAMINKEYCKRHEIELELKSEVYFKELCQLKKV